MKNKTVTGVGTLEKTRKIVLLIDNVKKQGKRSNMKHLSKEAFRKTRYKKIFDLILVWPTSWTPALCG